MGASIWQIIIGLPLLVLWIWLPVRILHRAGYSGWWVLLFFLPLVKLVMIWVFSFRRWPITHPYAKPLPDLPPPLSAP